jgi:hypothetical protein
MKYVALIAAFALMASAAGWAGQETWGPFGIALAMVLGLAISALFAYFRRQSDAKSHAWLMAPVWGAMLGVGIWIVTAELWGLNDMVLNSDLSLGAERVRDKSLLGVALGIGAGIIVALHVRRPKHRWARRIRLLVLTCWLSLLMTAFVLYLVRTGVENADDYPSREQSPYLLPWPDGVTRTCMQGNRAIISHRDEWSKYAFDFAMPTGSPISAARDGVVYHVVDKFDGNGWDKPANVLTIRHDDGTFADYGHIKQHGSLVHAGERVRQGQVVALSGNVGYSTSPHLHFQVYVWNGGFRSIPVTFRDVRIRSGIPRMWLRYTSGNAAPE